MESDLKTVVTGGAGFIGSALIWQLNREGNDDIVIVDHLGTGDKWRNLAGLRFQSYMHKDEFIQRVRAGDKAFDSVQQVAHLGACSSTTEPDADYLLENNTRYTHDVAEWALRIGARFVYASSAAVYGDGAEGFCDAEDVLPRLRPLNKYGYSKLRFDVEAARSGMLERIAGARFFNVFGPNEYHKGPMRSMVLKAWEQVSACGTVQLFRSHRPDYADGGQKRDFVYVRECAEILARLLDHPAANGIFNVGSGRAETWNDLAVAVFRAAGKPESVEFIDMPGELRNQYQYCTRADMTRLQQTGLQWRRWSLDGAVRDYVQNYLESGCARLDSQEEGASPA